MKYQEIFDYLATSQKDIIALQESILPSVGIFYYIDDVLELQNLNLPVARVRNKSISELKSEFEHLGFYVMEVDSKIYIGYNSLHVNMFKDIIKRLYKDINSYNDSPRGRIMYNATDDKFECIMDGCLDNIPIKKLIQKEFNIPKLEYNFDDDNYSCLSCI